MTEFESGAREAMQWAETSQHAVTAGAMDVIPHGGNPTGPYKSFQRGPSDEVRSDLQVQDNINRGYKVSAALSNVVRYGAHDKVMEQVFNGRWSAAYNSTVLTTLQTIAAGNKIHPTSGTPFAALAADLPCPVWICRGGASPIAGQVVIATALSGNDLVLATSSANGLTLTDVAAGDSVQVMHSGILKPGTEHIFALLQRVQAGLGHFYGGFGMMATKLDFKGQKGQDPTWSIDFEGLDCQAATATFGSGVVNAAPAWLGFNFGSDLKQFREGGSVVSTLFPRDVQWSLASPVSPIDPAGQDGPYAHQKNRMVLSGSLEFYSNDSAKAVGVKAQTPTDSSLFFTLQKTEGGVTRAYAKWVPLIQYEQTQQTGGGNDSALMTPLQWHAALSATYGLAMALARFTGVPLTLV